MLGVRPTGVYGSISFDSYNSYIVYSDLFYLVEKLNLCRMNAKSSGRGSYYINTWDGN